MQMLVRFGGVLVRPRATIAALESGRGSLDEWMLVVLYVLGSQLDRVAEALASAAALGSTNGVLVVASALGRAILPPILVSVLVDALLGRGRAPARGLLLVPLVLVATLARLAAQLGVHWPGPAYAPELVGALWCAGLALHLRSTTPPAVRERVSSEGR